MRNKSSYIGLQPTYLYSGQGVWVALLDWAAMEATTTIVGMVFG